MRNEFTGDIVSVRAAEDCIRATHKYTEGVARFPSPPIQGDGFPSRALTKFYEVYPDLDLSEHKPFWDAVMAASDWLWGDTPHIDVHFRYNYTNNRAKMTVGGSNGAMKSLISAVPGLEKALAGLVAPQEANGRN